jgi:RNA polymerase sigma-70 factor, ECF subfamily
LPPAETQSTLNLAQDVKCTEIAEWVKESQTGNVRAFELLYREYYQMLYLYCKRMTSQGGAAEELVQESFIKAWQALPKFRTESGFYTWLRTIASRLIIDRFRLKQEKIWQNSTSLDEAELNHQLLQTSAETSQSHKADLDKVISFLPEGARAVLVMYEIEGYKHKEIAEMLNIAEGTSKAQLARAKKLLLSTYATNRLQGHVR